MSIFMTHPSLRLRPRGFSRRLGWRFGRQRTCPAAARPSAARFFTASRIINPAALRAGHRAFDEDQAALDIGLHDTQIQVVTRSTPM